MMPMICAAPGRIGLLGLLLAMLALPVHADPLSDAKEAGAIGEQADGYLGIVQPPGSPDIRALVEDINGRRRTQYRGIAQRNGIELAAVEVLAAEKAINRTPAGQFIQLPDGSWRRK